jgi:Tol biopolymer transport system component
MNHDPAIRERLTHAADPLPVDVEARLADLRTRSKAHAARRRVGAYVVAGAIAVVAITAAWIVVPHGRVTQPVSEVGDVPTGTIAYAVITDPSVDTNEIHSLPLDGVTPGGMLRGAGSDPFVRWSPDGTRFAYVQTGDHSAIVIANADGSDPHDVGLGLNAEQIAWSPDGSRLAFRGPDATDGWTRISILDLGTGDVTPIPALDGSWRDFDWSPDGTRFALTGAPKTNGNAILSGIMGVYVANADGTRLQQIVPDATTEFVRWSPGGSRLAFGLRDPSDDGDYQWDVATVAPDGSDLTKLTSWKGWDHVPVWSPDGRWIAFGSDRDASPEQLAKNSSNNPNPFGGIGIYVMRSDGTDVHVLLPATDGQLVAPVDWRA